MKHHYMKKLCTIGAGFGLALAAGVSPALADEETASGTSVSSTFTVDPKTARAGQETSNVVSSDSVSWSLTALKVPFSPIAAEEIKFVPINTGTGFSDAINAKNNTPNAGNNTYMPGQCTWYAFDRRVQLGLRVGAFWGNAGTWAISARADGYAVDSNPRIGDIIAFSPGQDGAGYAGHVGIVEEIGANNSVRISEMNYLSPYNYNERWIFNANQHTYIH